MYSLYMSRSDVMYVVFPIQKAPTQFGIAIYGNLVWVHIIINSKMDVFMDKIDDIKLFTIMKRAHMSLMHPYVREVMDMNMDFLSEIISSRMYKTVCGERIVRECKAVLCNPNHKIGKSNLLREFSTLLQECEGNLPL